MVFRYGSEGLGGKSVRYSVVVSTDTAKVGCGCSTNRHQGSRGRKVVGTGTDLLEYDRLCSKTQGIRSRTSRSRHIYGR